MTPLGAFLEERAERFADNEALAFEGTRYTYAQVLREAKRVAADVLCECQRQRMQARNARFEATRPTSGERGYGGKWRRERGAYLSLNPTCRRCGEPATIVDHVRPHKGDWSLFWQRSNWQPLCVPCHSSFKQSLEKRQEISNDLS